MTEIWKALNGIVEHGDYYEVSNFGRVRSIDRYVTYKDGRKVFTKGSVLSLNNHTCGYLKITLWKDNKAKSYFVHRLVALAFLDNPQKLPQVNHKDENKKNNHLDNLEYCDEKYNTNYGNGHKKSAEKHRKPIKVYKYPSMEFVGIFESGRKASEHTGARPQNILKVIKGDVNHAKGYYFEYAEGDDNA